MTISLRHLYTAHSFVESEMAPAYTYEGINRPSQVIFNIPQAVISFDLNADDAMDVVIPMLRGYSTGVDTRGPFIVLQNNDGFLEFDLLANEIMPVTAGARRAAVIQLEGETSALVTVQHDTGDGRGGDLISIVSTVSHRLTGNSIFPDTPSAGDTGRSSYVNAHSLASGDINGDGLDDILIGDWTRYGTYAFLQNGDNNFELHNQAFLKQVNNFWPLETTGGGRGYNGLLDLHLEDFNNDGFDDLVAGWGGGTARSRVFWNKDGLFSASESTVLPESIYGIENQQHIKTLTADFDGDGYRDLLILYTRYEPYYGGHYWQYLRNDGKGGFVDETQIRFENPIKESYSNSLNWSDFWQITDVNSDGHLDLVGMTASNTFFFESSGLIYLNTGDGRFVEFEINIPSTLPSTIIQWGDFNENGSIELLTFERDFSFQKPETSEQFFRVYELLDQPVLEGRYLFSDIGLAFDTSGVAGQAYRIYKAAFDRDPMDGDTGGLGYWIAQMDNGMDMVEIAARFIDSDEFRSLYGQNPTNGEFLNKVYLNVLDRLPDAEGYDWWIDQLENNPEKTWQKVLADFSESPENQANVAELIANGIVFDPWVG
jgi:hypothetical protein